MLFVFQINKCFLPHENIKMQAQDRKKQHMINIKVNNNKFLKYI